MPTTITPHPGMLLADMTAEQAKALDASVDTLIATHAKASVELYVGLGRQLAKIHAGRGYRQLGFPTWKAYLAAKPDFGQTYLSYMVKLGEAAEMDLLDLEPYRSEGLTGSQLLEYAKATDYPKTIIDLIDMTWPDVKGKSVADAQKVIRQWVDAHWETYKARPKAAPQDKPDAKWEAEWESEFKNLDEPARAAFIKQMWSFLEHHDSGAPPHDD
jgi:hypothetical protein